MTDVEVATAYGVVKQLEVAARPYMSDTPETSAAVCVYRQAVALRRALGEWIVVRATTAQQTVTK